MKSYDVIVAGAGPAGSIAGYHLAKAGLDVLLIDKARFPRRKVCGGALTYRALRECPFDITPLIHHAVEWGYLGFRGKTVTAIHGDGPIAYLVDRTSFDDFLLRQALAQGADCQLGERATAIAQTSDAVTVQTDKDSYRSRFAIGADGVHSIVAAQLGLLPNGTSSLCYEARLTLPENSTPLANSITFDFGTLPWGYAWLFPKRDHLNVGVYRNWPGKKTTRKHLLRYINQHPALRGSDIINIRAFPDPAGGTPGPLHSGRVLLAGDAAHLADPWLGEGIYYAMASGRLAAETLLAQVENKTADLSGYSTRINDTFITQFQYARKMAVLVSLCYGFNLGLLKRSPSLRAATVDLLRGGRTHKEVWLAVRDHFPKAVRTLPRKK